MSSYPPLPFKRQASRISPVSRTVSEPGRGSHTIIDPFGSLTSLQTSEQTCEKTPRTPIDPLYMHPFQSRDDMFSHATIADKKWSPCSAAPSSPKVGLCQRENNPEMTPNGNTSKLYLSPARHQTDGDIKQTRICPHPISLSNSVTTHDSIDAFEPSHFFITPQVTTNNNTIEMNGGSKGRDDGSSDANMVICEPGGLIALLSRSFRLLLSFFQTPPLQIEFRMEKCGESRKEESDQDDLSDDEDSQDSSLPSQPSSPQTPLYYSNSPSWPGLAPSQPPALPPPIPAFLSPLGPLQGRPVYFSLPPSWLPWRAGCGRVRERRERRPPPPLPTLSPTNVDGSFRGRNSFPVLLPRPLAQSQCHWATMNADWVVQTEIPRQRDATSPFYGVSGIRSHSMASLGPSICCPISGGIMLEPVIDPDGFSYERSAILEWLSNHTTSPLTDRPLAPDQLRPNRTLQSVIQSLLQNMNAN